MFLSSHSNNLRANFEIKLTFSRFLQSIWRNDFFISKNTKNSVKKWVEDLNRYFSKEDMLMAKKHMKRCSTSLIVREVQVKTIMRYHLTPIRTAFIKKSINNKCWRGCGEKGNSLTLLVRTKLLQPLWRTVWRLLKKLKILLPYEEMILKMKSFTYMLIF